jgi:alkaline phosphatase
MLFKPAIINSPLPVLSIISSKLYIFIPIFLFLYKDNVSLQIIYYKNKIMKKISLVLSTLLFVLFVQCETVEGQRLNTDSQVKNVILLIGDGMGVSQITAGMTANQNRLNLERATFVGFSKTYAANDYVTDSAAGGTALACGEKTNNGAIGVDKDGKPIKSILEYAAESGLSTGMVVTCDLTHATPASFVAHQAKRSMEEDIAADFLKVPFTVAIGGGKNNFEKRKDGQNLTEQLKEKAYQVVYTLEEMNAVTSGRLIALLADVHLPTYPQRGEVLPKGVKTALNILSQNEKGFFLMVEGSQIDWASHENNTEAIINEVLDFDRAIKVAFDFADNNPGTLVVVTADHETGGMTLNGGSFETGKVNAKYTTGGHTGVMVPVFAYGAGAKEFAGIYENTDIFNKIFSLYDFKK